MDSETQPSCDVKIPDRVVYHGVPIHYVDKSEMGDSPYTFAPRSDGDGYNLLSMTQQKPSTGTIIMYLDGQIYNTANLAKILAVVKPEYNEMYPPKTITSIRREGVNKGDQPIRRGRADGGIFKNSTIADIWYDEGKRYCSTKYSERKLTMFGIVKQKAACKIGTYFVAHIRDALRFHRLLRDNIGEFNQAVDWIVERSKGEALEQFIINSDDDTLENQCDYKLVWTWDMAPAGKTYAEQLTSYFIDEIRRRYMFDTSYIVTTNELRARMDELIRMPDVASPDIKILGFQRTMVNYNYAFPFTINRIEMSRHLKSVGYTPDLHNSERTDLKVITYSPVTVDCAEIFRRDGSSVKQTFFFYKRGRVMHSGPGGKSSEDRYYDMGINLILIHAKLNA